MRKTQNQKPAGIKFLLLVMSAVLVIGGATYFLGLGDPEPLDRPPFLTSAEAAQPLPRTLEPSTFPDPSVSAAYAAAKEVPALLAQEPCYCGCHHMGHRSLLDCFKGQHASDCDVCLKEALFTLQEHRKGETATQIRKAIGRGAWQSIQL